MEFVVGSGYMLAATGPRWDPDVTPMGPRRNSNHKKNSTVPTPFKHLSCEKRTFKMTSSETQNLQRKTFINLHSTGLSYGNKKAFKRLI